MAGKWARTIERKVNTLIFKTAWRKAQKVRKAVELETASFFKDLVNMGINVEGAPNLGSYTAKWEPLSEDWIERKGHEEFYFATGSLERFLLSKSVTGVFGRPQVFLNWTGNSVKVHAGSAAKKYTGLKLKNLVILVIPFPKATGLGTNAEGLVAGSNDLIYYKLTGKDTLRSRPLVTPFLKWYIHVAIKRSITKAAK